MKKYLVFLNIFFGFHLVSIAQDTTEVYNPRFELGLNATSIIRHNLFKNTATVPGTLNTVTKLYPFDFLLNLRLYKGLYIRSGFSYVDQNVENVDMRVTESVSAALRVGFAYHKKIRNNLMVMIGIDLFKSGGSSSTFTKFELSPETPTFTIVTEQSNVGLGPIIGIGYDIKDNISLRMEGVLYYTSGELKYKTIRKDSGGVEVSISKFELNSLAYVSPLNILFFVRL